MEVEMVQTTTQINSSHPLLCPDLRKQSHKQMLKQNQSRTVNQKLNARCYRFGISQGLKANGAMLIIKQKSSCKC